MKQDYNAYTAADHNVWSILFERQVRHIQDKASRAYLDGLREINFEPDCVPNFTSLNKRLKQLSGWQLREVPGVVPYQEFFESLAAQFFPSTIWLRSFAQLDYLEEPDMFHDVFGHVPLLTNKDFGYFIQRLASLALKHIENSDAIDLISRLYWFTVEFGLIEEHNELRIYGAGILSSMGETTYALNSMQPTRRPFEISDLLSISYSKDQYQGNYFVLDSYDQLFQSLDELETMLKQRVAILM
jgi:phenylalanine-4-hydroxylase